MTLSYTGVTTRYKIEDRDASAFRGAARWVSVSALSLHEATIAADEVDPLALGPRKSLLFRTAGPRVVTPCSLSKVRDRHHSRR